MTRNGVKLEWNDCQDHSKWCVTEDHSNPWTCIADLNKALSQDERPGGALCIKNSDVREKFKGFIGHKEDCPRKRPKPS
uniref:Deoxyribonuclease-2-alpha n=1 Tax=Anguilla anguilla TaxID=7936 RepID=A0A0E9XW82_ANGAN